MIIKELIEKYKGEVLFNIKESNTDGELTDLVSFDTKELAAIKEDITSKEFIEEAAREKLDMYLPNEKV